MAYNLKLDVNDYMPLRDVVFITLRKAILRGTLKPRERLMEVSLAKKLGVSRTPVREAIRMLEHEGLVTMIPRRGAEVAGITEKGVRDVLEVRKALELLAIELACERMSDEEVAELESAMIAFRNAVDKSDPMAIAKADEVYHDIIFRSTGNEKLMLLINNLREQMYRYRLEYIKDADKRNLLLIEHENILRALKSRNLDEARRIVGEHIDNQEITVKKNIKEVDE